MTGEQRLKCSIPMMGSGSQFQALRASSFLRVVTYSVFRSKTKASATTKALLEISFSISRIDVFCSVDHALAPATRRGKKKNIPARFATRRASSTLVKILVT